MPTTLTHSPRDRHPVLVYSRDEPLTDAAGIAFGHEADEEPDEDETPEPWRMRLVWGGVLACVLAVWAGIVAVFVGMFG